MWLRGALLALGFLLAGCGHRPLPAPPLATAERLVTLSLTLEAPSRYGLLGVSHRWVPADIYQYEVTLQGYDPAGNLGPNPAVTVLLPQKGTVRSTAHFTNLRHGLKYEAGIVAKGNRGGTAPDLALNGQTVTRAIFDLTAGQDVETSHSWSGAVTLDPAPFSGSLRLEPQGLPTGTDQLRVTLRNDDTGAAIYSQTYLPTQTMTLTGLRVGVPYRAWLEALGAGVVLKTTSTGRYFFDPAGQDLEQIHASQPVF